MNGINADAVYYYLHKAKKLIKDGKTDKALLLISEAIDCVDTYIELTDEEQEKLFGEVGNTGENNG